MLRYNQKNIKNSSNIIFNVLFSKKNSLNCFNSYNNYKIIFFNYLIIIKLLVKL